MLWSPQRLTKPKTKKKGLTMQNMLSEALAEIGRLLNQLVTNLTGEDEAKRNEWLVELKKFLRKEACWVSVTVQAVVESTRTLVVDYTMSLEDMIVAGKYNWANDNITAKRFSVAGTGTEELEWDLWDPRRDISSGDALKGQQTEDNDENNPWRSATLAELLAFGAKYPDAQRKNPIVALASVARVHGGRDVAYLCGDGSLRYLDLSWWGSGWGSDYRFLRVRKLVKKT
jgi:hypothetical protein